MECDRKKVNDHEKDKGEWCLLNMYHKEDGTLEKTKEKQIKFRRIESIDHVYTQGVVLKGIRGTN